jgi:hypothetical protein
MIVLALTRAPDASASVVYTSPYTFDQTFGAGLRLVRVDLGFKILEKDKDLGYVLFEYTSPESGKRISNGSMELVETKNGVHVSVQIPQMPQYHERMIVDQLSKKLESEYGEPPARDKDKDRGKDRDKGKDREGDKDRDKDKEKDKDTDRGGDPPSDGDKPKDEQSVD